MPTNILITGPPRSGKTTVIERTKRDLEHVGHRAGGIVCPERRVGGTRVGFDIVDVMTGETAALADVDRETGPRVGKYRVLVENVDRLSALALPHARRAADFVVIDEIAPMEVYSDVFVREVEATLDAHIPVIAAIHEQSTAGFIGAVKARDDVELHVLDKQTRETLPARLAELLRGTLTDGS